MTVKLAVKPKAETVIIHHDSRYDLIIIGGGPAGLTAAIYACRERLKTLIVEKMIFGGAASTAAWIENYPGFPDGVSGIELSQKMSQQLAKLEPEIVWGSASQITKENDLFTVNIDGQKYFSRAVIFTTGTQSVKLGVPGEEEFRGRGVSYCAVCDGAFYKDKQVMVVGGGNSAIEEALFLTRYATKVSVVHRRDELRADRLVAERAKSHPQIYFFWHTVLQEIKGDKNVAQAVLKDLQNGKNLVVPVDGIFVYVGSKPNSELVAGLAKLDEHGFIITDQKMKTSQPGLFAAGDVRAGTLRQVVTAAADGAIAAESARDYIEAPAQ